MHARAISVGVFGIGRDLEQRFNTAFTRRDDPELCRLPTD